MNPANQLLQQEPLPPGTAAGPKADETDQPKQTRPVSELPGQTAPLERDQPVPGKTT